VHTIAGNVGENADPEAETPCLSRSKTVDHRSWVGRESV